MAMVLKREAAPVQTEQRERSLTDAMIQATRQAYGLVTGQPVNMYAWMAVQHRIAEDTRWLDYMKALSAHSAAARAAQQFWYEARQSVGPTLGAPITMPDEEGSVHLAWERNRHYFEIDFFADGSAEWFYRDRSSGALDGTEISASTLTLSNAILRRLKLVAQ